MDISVLISVWSFDQGSIAYSTPQRTCDGMEMGYRLVDISNFPCRSPVIDLDQERFIFTTAAYYYQVLIGMV